MKYLGLDDVEISAPKSKPISSVLNCFIFWKFAIFFLFAEANLYMIFGPPSDPSILKKPWFLQFCDFFMTFYLWRMTQIYLQNLIGEKIFIKKYFWLSYWRSLTKRAGSESVPDPKVRGGTNTRSYVTDLELIVSTCSDGGTVHYCLRKNESFAFTTHLPNYHSSST